MEYNKKISVIVPCHNSVKYIVPCLEYIKNQTIGMNDLEVILVNDASTDNTLDYLLNFEKEYPDSVIVLNLDENIKQGGARNIAMNYSSGKYIAFIDSDDWISIDTYEKIYNLAEENDAEIVQFGLKYMKNNDCTGERMYKYTGLIDGTDVNHKKDICLGHVFDIGHQTKLYRSSFVKTMGAEFSVGMIFEEPLFVVPIVVNITRAYVTNELFYHMRIDNDESTTKNYLCDDLYRHAKGYLDTYIKCRSFSSYYSNKEEIDYYFISRYMQLTLIFFASKGWLMDYSYFDGMKKIIKELIPDWKQNIYLKKDITYSIYTKALEQTKNENTLREVELEFYAAYKYGEKYENL